MATTKSTSKRHHFLPQFLQKGFASQIIGDKVYVFQFRRAHEPVEAITENVGVQKYFHGDPHEFDLEGQMSLEESRVAPYIERLRSGIPVDDNRLVAEFVTNMSIRTKNLRDNIWESTSAFLTTLEKAFATGDKRKLRNLAQKQLKKELRKSEVGEKIDQLPRFMKKVLGKKIENCIRQLDLRSDLSSHVAVARSMLDVKKLAADSHIKALRNQVTPEKRVTALSNLIWQVIPQQETWWILGDVACLGWSVSSKTLVNAVNVDWGELGGILIPISSKALLVGQSSQSGLPFNPTEINIASAELSHSFFIAAQNTELEALYHQHLGLRKDIVTQEEIDELCHSFAGSPRGVQDVQQR